MLKIKPLKNYSIYNRVKTSSYFCPQQILPEEISPDRVSRVPNHRDSPNDFQNKRKYLNSVEDNYTVYLKNTLKSIQNSYRMQKKDKIETLLKVSNLTEWKEFARKLDWFLFVVTDFF